MELKYFGHSCFSVKIEKYNLLFDPFITGNPLPVASSIDVKAIKADFILVSHAHRDHMADALMIGSQSNSVLISTSRFSAGLTQRD
jgi:L-ascorbate metabolism protein UlaG (beta-lactamase superfamily)